LSIGKNSFITTSGKEVVKNSLTMNIEIKLIGHDFKNKYTVEEYSGAIKITKITDTTDLSNYKPSRDCIIERTETSESISFDRQDLHKIVLSLQKILY
jgi:hypothetical protein